jgi:hypothetical protein
MMYRLSILFCSLLICAQGAAAARSTYTVNEPRPVVAFLPVGDNTHNGGLPWDISKELTERCSHPSKKVQVEIISQKEVAAVVASLKGKNLQRQEPAFFKQFKGTDFVALVEILNHTNQGHKAHIVSIQARVKVIDLRDGNAKLILNKLIEANQMISFSQPPVDYTRSGWGTEGYGRTPVALAHEKLANDIVTRVEAAVNLALQNKGG